MLINAVFAADFKIGYVDVSKIFTTSKPAVAVKNHLTNKFAPKQQELKKLGDNLAKEQAEVQELVKKAPSIDKLSAADKSNLEKLDRQFQKNQMAYQQKAMQYQQIAQKTQDFASALVLDKVNSILKDISEKGGYDLVLTSQQLVYAKAKYNITDQVIEQLNAAVNGAEIIKQLEKAEKQAAGAITSPHAISGKAQMPAAAPTATAPVTADAK